MNRKHKLILLETKPPVHHSRQPYVYCQVETSDCWSKCALESILS